MKYPQFTEIPTSAEMVTTFNGLDTRISCKDGFFRDMKNITADDYPVLSPRLKRGIMNLIDNPLGMLDKEDLYWVDDSRLYKNGVIVDDIDLDYNTQKQMVKMGAYLVIMPDKVWYNTETGEYGNIEHTYQKTSVSVIFNLCNENGEVITTHDAEYYETTSPQEGDYLIETNANGTSSLKRYSKSTSMWVSVTTTYMSIIQLDIGEGLKEGDGVYISISTKDKDLKKVFVNDEGNGVYSNNFVIKKAYSMGIVVQGIIPASKTITTNITVKRKMPDMAFLTECQNRLWGCSTDGHEIYCCKLGDVTNWNVFAGISTDSYSATIGSDGVFTGAITYNGYPYFFKENSFIRVTVSATGAHQTKETQGRGVQAGSHNSLKILNEILYYKANDAVVVYTGAIPASISDVFGEEKYSDATAGILGNKYYISMKDEAGNYALFVYDVKKQVWIKEDNTHALYFANHGNDLLFIDGKDNTLKSVRGTTPFESTDEEGKLDWEIISGNLGYSISDQKYVSRINVRASLEVGTQIDLYIQYDSSGIWEHKLSMYGNGTKTFTLPIIPKRCDHFSYKVKGKGNAKIFGITRTIEKGSDNTW